MYDLINRSFEKALSIQSWRHLLVKLICMPVYLISFCLVFFIRLLRPVITMRVGFLDAGRIGAMMYADRYLCEKAYGLHKKVLHSL